MSRISSQCTKAKFSVWSSRHSCGSRAHRRLPQTRCKREASARGLWHTRHAMLSRSCSLPQAVLGMLGLELAGKLLVLAFAWMDPPRDTMPVTRLAVSGMCRSSTPA